MRVSCFFPQCIVCQHVVPHFRKKQQQQRKALDAQQESGAALEAHQARHGSIWRPRRRRWTRAAVGRHRGRRRFLVRSSSRVRIAQAPRAHSTTLGRRMCVCGSPALAANTRNSCAPRALGSNAESTAESDANEKRGECRTCHVSKCEPVFCSRSSVACYSLTLVPLVRLLLSDQGCHNDVNNHLSPKICMLTVQ